MDKTAVVAAKDRATKQVAARVVEHPDQPTLQGFVVEQVDIYTDSASAYKGLPNHQAVAHSTGEYMRGDVGTQGVESWFSMLKRAHKGTFHKMSPKHLQRYVNEFAGRHNIREAGKLAQMAFVAAKLAGRHLPYARLIADDGLPSGARS